MATAQRLVVRAGEGGHGAGAQEVGEHRAARAEEAVDPGHGGGADEAADAEAAEEEAVLAGAQAHRLVGVERHEGEPGAPDGVEGGGGQGEGAQDGVPPQEAEPFGDAGVDRDRGRARGGGGGRKRLTRRTRRRAAAA